MNRSDATREVLWNIEHPWVMYALLLPTTAVALYGIWRRVRGWRRGQSENRFDRPLERWGSLRNTRCCSCAPGGGRIPARFTDCCFGAS